METYHYLIIGGGIAGTSAAEIIQAKDKNGTIAIVSEESYPLYSRILISKPNFLLEKIKPDQVFLKQDAWYKENKIELIKAKTAIALNAKDKEVTLSDGEVIGYKKLLIATGGRVKKLELEGSEQIQYVRTLDDGKVLLKKLKVARTASVLGAGFISFEACDILRKRGIQTSVYLRKNYFFESLWDEASGKMVEEALRNAGIQIFPNFEFTKLPSADLIIGGFGMRFDLEWLKSAGIKTNNGILANEYLETNFPGIYAAGDIAEFHDVIEDEQIQLGNWVSAQMQGRCAGLNMAGEKKAHQLVSSYTTTGLGLTIAFVGDVRPLPDRKVKTIGSPKEHSYGRILMKGKKIMGATLINQMSELGEITKAIRGSV